MTARELGAGVQRESEGRKRMSCNGCRVLRKGCSDTCILRPCLQWIESPEAQGHATVFVAKFFGRAGLMSFINAVPDSQRPALFQSLLYEACGRTVNPVFGAVGLLGSGNWHVCQAAVETVLKGGTLRPSQSSSAIATCSSRPSLTSAYRLNSSSAATTSHTVAPSVKTELQLPLSQAQLFTNNQSDDQHRQRELLRKVKSEFPESSFTDTIQHPYRRVRQRLETADDESGSPLYGSACNDNIANLDLTLNCDGDGWRVKRRVSSPSLVSVNSEGSVTSLESGSLPHHHVHTSSSSLRRIELDLFP